MLFRVREQLAEHRARSSWHRSEQDPTYLRLVMLEQGLRAHIKETASAGATSAGGIATAAQPMGSAAAAAARRDPKSRSVMDKIKRGQTLTPSEQATANQLAVGGMTQEGVMARRLVRESEIQQAQVVLAAQDMIDRVQGMIEDISEMQFKDLPALVDSIRNDMGTQQASQFQQQATQGLAQLLAAVQEGKTQLEAAQAVLTGQEIQVPGQESDQLAGGSDDGFPSLPEPDLGDEELPEPQGGVELGRQRR